MIGQDITRNNDYSENTINQASQSILKAVNKRKVLEKAIQFPGIRHLITEWIQENRNTEGDLSREINTSMIKQSKGLFLDKWLLDHSMMSTNASFLHSSNKLARP